MELEKLTPSRLAEEIKKRLAQLTQILEQCKKDTVKLPQGHLKLSNRGSYSEYYQIIKIGSDKGQYIPRKNIKLAKGLAQKDYNYRLIKVLEKECKLLQSYLTATNSGMNITKVYHDLHKVRQQLITPITLTDEEYIKKWLDIKWQGRPFADDTPELFTTKGERVRSKSEILIADTLNRLGVPYRYEYPFKLKNGITVYPDFLCLNVRSRQEYYWEHFGMMDNSEYAEKTVHKLQDYSENNLISGLNLIITMESSSTPLKLTNIEKQIDTYLLS